MAFVFPSFTVWPHCIYSIGPGYCFQQSGRVCVLVTNVGHAKMTELIEIQFSGADLWAQGMY